MIIESTRNKKIGILRKIDSGVQYNGRRCLITTTKEIIEIAKEKRNDTKNHIKAK